MWDNGDDFINVNTLVPKGKASITYVWGFTEDGISDPKDFFIHTDGTETVDKVWIRLEEVVRKYHAENYISTRFFFLEAVTTKNEITEFCYGT